MWSVFYSAQVQYHMHNGCIVSTSVKCCAGSKKPNCQFAERKGTQRVVCQIQRSSYKSWHTKPGREPRRTFFHFVCLANANTPASAVQAWTDQETLKKRFNTRKTISIKGNYDHYPFIKKKKNSVQGSTLFNVNYPFLVLQIKPLTVLLLGHELCPPFTSV